MKRLILPFLLVLVALWFGAEGRDIHAQPVNSQAAVLTILYRDVKLQRANTQTWIDVPTGAIMPIGAGDRVDTGAYGRALMQFGDSATVLILPQTVVQLGIYALDDKERATIELESIGLIVQRTNMNRIAAYDLQSDELHITEAATLFAVWSSADNPDSVIVAEGNATVAHDELYQLEASTGYRSNHEGIIPLAPPLNEARLIAVTEGCPGVIETRNDELLLVRAGSAVDSLSMGGVADGETVSLLAISQNGLRLRIQHLSDFGWVETLAVDTTCTDLPALPVPYTEFFRTVYDVMPEEAPLLEPFYGPPFEDPWFYRFTTQ